MFKKYDSIEDYNADTLAPDEKRVSLIMDRDYVVDVKYDAPMREVTLPAVGDTLFIENNGGAKHFYRDANDTPNGMTLVGFVFNVKGNKVKIMNKNWGYSKWMSCWQYAITAVSTANISITLYNGTTINVTLTDSSNDYLNSTSATQITSALETAFANASPEYYWAWYDSTNNRIVVQIDFNANNAQNTISGTGCTIRLIMDDMPTHNLLLLRKGVINMSGVVNVPKAVTYYATNGSTPTSNVAVTSTNIVKKTAFESLSYCNALREKYGTYENYILANSVKYPQKYGVFTLMGASKMTLNYGNMLVPLKSGSEVYKYPVFHFAATVNYNANGLRTGSWYLGGITDIVEYTDKDTLLAVNKSVNKLSHLGFSYLPSYNVAVAFANRATSNNVWVYVQTEGRISASAGISSSFYTSAICTLTLDLATINQSNNS